MTKGLPEEGTFNQGMISGYRGQHNIFPEFMQKDPFKGDESDLPLEIHSPQLLQEE